MTAATSPAEMLKLLGLSILGGFMGALLAKLVNHLHRHNRLRLHITSPRRIKQVSTQSDLGRTTLAPGESLHLVLPPLPPELQARVEAGESFDVLQGPIESEGDHFKCRVQFVIGGEIVGHMDFRFGEEKK